MKLVRAKIVAADAVATAAEAAVADPQAAVVAEAVVEAADAADTAADATRNNQKPLNASNAFPCRLAGKGGRIERRGGLPGSRTTPHYYSLLGFG